MLLDFDSLGAWKWPLVLITAFVGLFLLLPILFIDQVGTGTDLYASPATRFVGDALVRGVPVHGTARPGAASLLLRPERISLARGTGEGLPVTVTDVTFLGNTFHVATATPRGEPLSVRLPFGHEAATSLDRGETVRLTFDPASAHVFC